MKPRTTNTIFNAVTRCTTVAIACLACSAAFAAEKPELTDAEKTLYAIGLSVTRSLAVFTLTQEEFEIVKRGISDAHAGIKSDVDITAYSVKIQELAKARRKALGDKQVSAGKEFLEKATKEKGAVKTPSGMVYTQISEGKGDSPKTSDFVKVNYRGTLTDGKEFDSSYKRNRSLDFKLDSVIKCWIEGIQMMKPGGKAKFVCPPELAYGENGAGDLILPGATLAFDVELLEFKSSAATAAPPPAPSVTAPEKPAVEKKAKENGKEAPHKH